MERAREYPWVSLGVAAAAGFIGTTLVVPSREQQALARLAAIEKALNPPKSSGTNHDSSATPSEKSGSLFMIILREVLALVRPLLLSLLTAGMAGRQSDPGGAAATESASEPVPNPT